MVKALTHSSTSNRDRIDIVSNILETVNGGASRRMILLRVGLSSNQFKRYLSLLVRDGYIEVEEEDERKIYRATGKGIDLLNAYNNIRELLQH